MVKRIFSLLLFSVSLVPLQAMAGNYEDPAIYFAFRGAVSSTKVKESSDNDVDVNPFFAAIGTQFAGTPFRAEIEYGNYTNMKYDANWTVGVDNYKQDAKIGMHTIMANFYLDMPYEECCPPLLRPYAFAGFGMTFLNADVKEYKNGVQTGKRSNDDNPWAWKVGAGVDIALTQAMHVELRYQYFQNFSGDDLNVEVKSSDFVFGLRFNMY